MTRQTLHETPQNPFNTTYRLWAEAEYTPFMCKWRLKMFLYYEDSLSFM